MSNEECFKLKVGQIIYSNHGANPLKIVAVPRIGEHNDFIVMDIHDCKHVESSKYIKENFEIKPIKLMTREEAAHLSEVLKAYSEGKSIERHIWVNLSCGESEEWQKIDNLTPDIISHYTLRIKPEPKYRPYKNAEEFLKAQKEHGPYINTESFETLEIYTIPYSINNLRVYWKAGYLLYSDWERLSHCTWQDGTPCAILEE